MIESGGYTIQRKASGAGDRSGGTGNEVPVGVVELQPDVSGGIEGERERVECAAARRETEIVGIHIEETVQGAAGYDASAGERAERGGTVARLDEFTGIEGGDDGDGGPEGVIGIDQLDDRIGGVHRDTHDSGAGGNARHADRQGENATGTGGERSNCDGCAKGIGDATDDQLGLDGEAEGGRAAEVGELDQ